jgi:sigma-B regulation protein RsbU (phosphoserine phosphatase)
MTETLGDLVGRNASILFSSEAESEANYDEFVEKSRLSGGAIETKIADVDYSLVETEIGPEDGKYLAVMLEDISEKRNIERKANAHLRKYHADVNMAGQIQKSILPKDGSYWDLVRLSSIYLPAEYLSGDTYDIVRLSDDEALMYIADVSGHGIQASLLTMFINEKIRANGDAARNGLDVLLAEILRGYKDLGVDAMMYISVLCCKYSKSRGELSIANAGHNCYPLILRSGGRTEEAPVRGMPISMISDEGSFEEEIIGISPGDRLLLYTDGIVEEYSKIEKSIFGTEGVRRVAEASAGLSGKGLAERVVAEAAKYAMLTATDDRTLMVAEMM